jgi:hypothetical protein
VAPLHCWWVILRLGLNTCESTHQCCQRCQDDGAVASPTPYIQSSDWLRAAATHDRSSDNRERRATCTRKPSFTAAPATMASTMAASGCSRACTPLPRVNSGAMLLETGWASDSLLQLLSRPSRLDCAGTNAQAVAIHIVNAAGINCWMVSWTMMSHTIGSTIIPGMGVLQRC